jgi:hypothetical protein
VSLKLNVLLAAALVLAACGQTEKNGDGATSGSDSGTNSSNTGEGSSASGSTGSSTTAGASSGSGSGVGGTDGSGTDGSDGSDSSTSSGSTVMPCETDAECDTGFCDLEVCAEPERDGGYGTVCDDEFDPLPGFPPPNVDPYCASYRCKGERCRSCESSDECGTELPSGCYIVPGEPGQSCRNMRGDPRWRLVDDGPSGEGGATQ